MPFKIIDSAEYGESFDTRFRMKTKNGDYMWVLSRGFVVCCDEHGKAIRLVGIHINTDTSEAIVNKLAVQHDRMRFALDTAKDGLWDWSPATGEVYFSPRYIEMCGYRPEEFPQCRIVDRTPPSGRSSSSSLHGASSLPAITSVKYAASDAGKNQKPQLIPSCIDRLPSPSFCKSHPSPLFLKPAACHNE